MAGSRTANDEPRPKIEMDVSSNAAPKMKNVRAFTSEEPDRCGILPVVEEALGLAKIEGPHEGRKLPPARRPEEGAVGVMAKRPDGVRVLFTAGKEKPIESLHAPGEMPGMYSKEYTPFCPIQRALRQPFQVMPHI